MTTTTREQMIDTCWCDHCGHPVMALRAPIDAADDTDRTGAGRERCRGYYVDHAACESHAVAMYTDGVLVLVD